MSEDAAVADEAITDETVEADATTTEETELETSSEESVSEDAEPSEPSPEPKKDKVQDRIDELTKKFRDAERDAAHWRNKAHERPAPEPVINLDTKSLADFDYDEPAYQAHITQQAKAEALRLVNETHQNQSANVKMQQFSAKEAEFAEKNDDYFNATRKPSLTLTQDMLEIAQDSELGPELLYHLGKHPSVALRLSALTPMAQAREMGILEAKLSTPVSKTVSTAPKPAPKIKGAANKLNKDPNDMSDSEFRKWRHKQIANR